LVVDEPQSRQRFRHAVTLERADAAVGVGDERAGGCDRLDLEARLFIVPVRKLAA
jgi:hypothetical protein